MSVMALALSTGTKRALKNPILLMKCVFVCGAEVEMVGIENGFRLQRLGRPESPLLNFCL